MELNALENAEQLSKALWSEMDDLRESAQRERVKYEVDWKNAGYLATDKHDAVFQGAARYGKNYCTVPKTAEAISIQYGVVTENPIIPRLTAKETNEPPTFVDLEGNPIEPQEGAIEITDQVVADALTAEVQSQWELSETAELVRHSLYETLVLGHNDLMFQWDADQQMGELMNLYPFNCWIDPLATGIRDAQFYIITEYLTEEQALRAYPEYREEIVKSLSSSLGHSRYGAMRGDRHANLQDREFVEVETWWQRDVPVPLTEDEALSRGLIQEITEQVDLGEDDSEDAVYILTESGELTSLDAENWPNRYAIQQRQFLAHTLIDDRELELVEIPIGRMGSMPIAKSPYFIGTPMKLYRLQEIYNELWTIHREYCKKYPNPNIAMPASAVNEMSDAVQTMFSESGQVIKVPDDLMSEFGGIQGIVQPMYPPQMNQVFSELLGRIETAMDNAAGTVEVLRGQAKSEWSGETVAQLTSAARGPIGAYARQSADAVKRLVRVWVDAIVRYMPAEELARRNSKYPVGVWRAIKQRADKIQLDIQVEVTGASAKEARLNRLPRFLDSLTGAINSGASPTLIEHLIDLYEIPEGRKIAQEIVEATRPPEPLPEEAAPIS